MLLGSVLGGLGLRVPSPSSPTARSAMAPGRPARRHPQTQTASTVSFCRFGFELWKEGQEPRAKVKGEGQGRRARAKVKGKGRVGSGGLGWVVLSRGLGWVRAGRADVAGLRKRCDGNRRIRSKSVTTLFGLWMSDWLAAEFCKSSVFGLCRCSQSGLPVG